MNSIRVNLTIVFDTLKDRLSAQTFIFDKLNTLVSAKESFNVSRLGLVQWSDPMTNEVKTFAKNGTDYYRYTASIECTYTSEDDYISVQTEFTKLFSNEQDLFFNIQNIDAYIYPINSTADTTVTKENV